MVRQIGVIEPYLTSSNRTTESTRATIRKICATSYTLVCLSKFENLHPRVGLHWNN